MGKLPYHDPIMPGSKHVASYPPSMLKAIERAVSLGEFVIPSDKPKALRLHFYKLLGALRFEKRSELADLLEFRIQTDPPALVLSLRESSPQVSDIEKALASETPQVSQQEAAAQALDRILAGLPPLS